MQFYSLISIEIPVFDFGLVFAAPYFDVDGIAIGFSVYGRKILGLSLLVSFGDKTFAYLRNDTLCFLLGIVWLAEGPIIYFSCLPPRRGFPVVFVGSVANRGSMSRAFSSTCKTLASLQSVENPHTEVQEKKALVV